MGGTPSKGTPADRRLAANKGGKTATPKSGGKSAGGSKSSSGGGKSSSGGGGGKACFDAPDPILRPGSA